MTIDGQDPISADQLAIDGDRANRRNFMKKVAVGGAVVWASPAITSSLTAAAAASLTGTIPGTGGTFDGAVFTLGGSTFPGNNASAGPSNKTPSGTGMLVSTTKINNGTRSQTFSIAISGTAVKNIVFTVTDGTDATETFTITATGTGITVTSLVGPSNVVTWTISGTSITGIGFNHALAGNVTTHTATISQYTVTT